MAAIELDERIGYSASGLAGQPYKGCNGRVEVSASLPAPAASVFPSPSRLYCGPGNGSSGLPLRCNVPAGRLLLSTPRCLTVRGCGRFPGLSRDETCLLKNKKFAPLSFISNMVRSGLPSYASWATFRKEICGVGSVHGKQVAEQKNPFVISPVTQMSKNRLPLNILLTTAAAWRLPAEFRGAPAAMCSLG